MRNRNAAGEQRRENASGDTGLVQFLADDQRVGAVAVAAADRLGKSRTQQPGRPGVAVQFAGQVADSFPLVDVGQDLALRERAHGLAQLFALRV